MPTLHTLIAFGLVALGMALSPGPNMIHLVSRALFQGRRAAFYSLLGVALGFLIWMLATALGLTAVLSQRPALLQWIRYTGAAYLLYLAFQTLKPGPRSPLQLKRLQPQSRLRLFSAGLLTNLLNPKIALVYMSLLPQFIDDTHGSVLMQAMVLGAVQICIGTGINGVITFSAASLAQRMSAFPRWSFIQRWVMGSIFSGLAVRMVVSK